MLVVKHSILIWAIVLHHTQVHENQSPIVIEAYHRSQGRKGLAYHYYIEQDGTISVGHSIDFRGEHALGRNNGTIGVCLSGDFSWRTTPSDLQLQALVKVCTEIKQSKLASPSIKILTHKELMRIRVGSYKPIYTYDCPGNLKDHLIKYVNRTMPRAQVHQEEAK